MSRRGGGSKRRGANGADSGAGATGKDSKPSLLRHGGCDQSLAQSAAYQDHFTPIRLSAARTLRIPRDDPAISNAALARRTVELIQCQENTLGRLHAATAPVRAACVLWCVVLCCLLFRRVCLPWLVACTALHCCWCCRVHAGAECWECGGVGCLAYPCCCCWWLVMVCVAVVVVVFVRPRVCADSAPSRHHFPQL